MKNHLLSPVKATLALLLAPALSLSAQTWTGEGTGNNWSTAANWSGTPPSAGGGSDVTLTFNYSVNQTSSASTNDLTGNFSLNRLVFNTTVNSTTRSIGGNTLEFVKDDSTDPRISQDGLARMGLGNALFIGTGIELTLDGTANTSRLTDLNSTISGAGSLRVERTQWIINNGDSTFSGGITLDAAAAGDAQLIFAASSTGAAGSVTSGPAGTGTITLIGGTLRTTSSATHTLNNDVDIAGDVRFGANSPTTSSLTLGGATTLTGNTTRSIEVSTNDATATPVVLAGAISGTGTESGITLTGSGVLEFSGSGDNTYEGLTFVNQSGATLFLNKSGGATAVAGNLTISNGRVRLGGNDQIATTSVVAVNGSLSTFDLNGFSTSFASLAGTSGSTITSGVAGAVGITLGNSTLTPNYLGIIEDGSGTVSLTKNGSGTQVLSGTNTYSGGTTLNDGDLVVNNNAALGSGTLLVNGGNLRPTFSVDRTIENAVEIGGDFSAGAAATGSNSTLTLNGTTTLLGSAVTRTITAGSPTTSSNRTPLVFAGAIGDGGNANGITIAANDADTRVVFEGVNTYTGLTTVSSGTLVISATGSIASSAGVLVDTDATLDVTAAGLTVGSGKFVGGDGTIDGDLTLASGALFAFNPANTLTLNGTFSLDSSFGVASLRDLSGGALDWGTIADDTYTLLNTSFTFNAGNISNFGLANAANIGGGRSAYFANGSLDLVVIPEPSTWALLAGSLALGLVGFRRRRRA